MSTTAVQIFGIKGSQATRAAERYLKERSITFHSVDLHVRPMSKGELRPWLERFGVLAILDTSSRAYTDGGLGYMKLSESEWLARIEAQPMLLRLPLVRAAKVITLGRDEEGWNQMLALAKHSSPGK